MLEMCVTCLKGDVMKTNIDAHQPCCQLKQHNQIVSLSGGNDVKTKIKVNKTIVLAVILCCYEIVIISNITAPPGGQICLCV